MRENTWPIDADRSAVRRRRQRSLAHYFQADKRLIGQDSSELFWRHRENIQPETTHHYLVGGSIFSELALTGYELVSSERHALLDMGEWDIKEAYANTCSKHELQAGEEYQRFLRPPEMLRIESQLATLEIFRAMIDGDVTLHARKKYYEDILGLAVKASEGFVYFDNPSHEEPSSRSKSFIGLAHELNAQLAINRVLSPTLCAFASFARGDSGSALPEQTHDLFIAHLKWGRIKQVITGEVKTTATDEHFQRYDAVIIGGTLHLHPDHIRDPSYLTELFAKEIRGIATQEEIDILDTITQNVLHVARHGFNKTEQCRRLSECSSDRE